MTESIPGYDCGRPESAKSPLSIEELRQLEATVGWSDEDADVLQRHVDIFRNHAEEIGRRHTPSKKNKTEDAATPTLIPLRYLLGFLPVVTLNTRKLFVAEGVDGQELRKLEDAWAKAVQLHVTLWTRPYTKHGMW